MSVNSKKVCSFVMSGILVASMVPSHAFAAPLINVKGTSVSTEKTGEDAYYSVLSSPSLMIEPLDNGSVKAGEYARFNIMQALNPDTDYQEISITHQLGKGLVYVAGKAEINTYAVTTNGKEFFKTPIKLDMTVHSNDTENTLVFTGEGLKELAKADMFEVDYTLGVSENKTDLSNYLNEQGVCNIESFVYTKTSTTQGQVSSQESNKVSVGVSDVTVNDIPKANTNENDNPNQGNTSENNDQDAQKEPKKNDGIFGLFNSLFQQSEDTNTTDKGNNDTNNEKDTSTSLKLVPQEEGTTYETMYESGTSFISNDKTYSFNKDANNKIKYVNTGDTIVLASATGTRIALICTPSSTDVNIDYTDGTLDTSSIETYEKEVEVPRSRNYTKVTADNYKIIGFKLVNGQPSNTKLNAYMTTPDQILDQNMTVSVDASSNNIDTDNTVDVTIDAQSDPVTANVKDVVFDFSGSAFGYLGENNGFTIQNATLSTLGADKDVTNDIINLFTAHPTDAQYTVPDWVIADNNTKFTLKLTLFFPDSSSLKGNILPIKVKTNGTVDRESSINDVNLHPSEQTTETIHVNKPVYSNFGIQTSNKTPSAGDTVQLPVSGNIINGESHNTKLVVDFSHTLPADWNVTASSNNGVAGVYDPDANTVTWDYGTKANGSLISETITIKIPDNTSVNGKTVTSTYTVSGSNADSVSGNTGAGGSSSGGSGQTSTFTVTEPIVNIMKSASNDTEQIHSKDAWVDTENDAETLTVNVGDTVNYTVTAAQTAENAKINNVVLTDGIDDDSFSKGVMIQKNSLRVKAGTEVGLETKEGVVTWTNESQDGQYAQGYTINLDKLEGQANIIVEYTAKAGESTNDQLRGQTVTTTAHIQGTNFVSPQDAVVNVTIASAILANNLYSISDYVEIGDTNAYSLIIRNIDTNKDSIAKNVTAELTLDDNATKLGYKIDPNSINVYSISNGTKTDITTQCNYDTDMETNNTLIKTKTNLPITSTPENQPSSPFPTIAENDTTNTLYYSMLLNTTLQKQKNNETLDETEKEIMSEYLTLTSEENPNTDNLNEQQKAIYNYIKAEKDATSTLDNAILVTYNATAKQVSETALGNTFTNTDITNADNALPQVSEHNIKLIPQAPDPDKTSETYTDPNSPTQTSDKTPTNNTPSKTSRPENTTNAPSESLTKTGDNLALILVTGVLATLVATFILQRKKKHNN